MKNITFFFLMLFLSLQVSAQITFNWEAQTISPGNNLKALNVVNDTTTILVGYGKTFVVSPDQGETWNKVPILNPQFNFYDISINSTGLGYACAADEKVIDNPTGGEEDVYADGVLLKTSDFGTSWSVIDVTKIGPVTRDDPENFPNAYGCYASHFYSVEVLENNAVYIGMEWYYHDSGTGARISYAGVFRTTDGETWTNVVNDKYPMAIESVGTTVYFGGSNHLKKLADETGTITDVYPNLSAADGDDPTMFLNDFTILSEDNIYITTATNGIFRTSDMGANIEKLATAPAGGNDFFVLNDTVMMLLGTGSKSVVSVDSGQTWTNCYPGTSCWEIGGIMNDSVVCLAKTSLYKIAVEDVLNLNFNWVEQEIKENENLQKMHIIDANKAIVVGFGQAFVSTANGGLSWENANLPELYVSGASYDFSAVSTKGKASFAVTRRIYQIPYPTNSPLTVYGHGLVYKSMDYWKTWELLDYRNIGEGIDQAMNPNAAGCYGLSPTEIECVNDTTAFMYVTWLDTIAGFEKKLTHSNVFKTEDGGDSWLPVLDDLGSRYINEIDFLDENTGFFVGNTILRKTNDGGETIEDMYPDLLTASPNDSALFLNEIVYIDENEWYLPTSVDGIFGTTEGSSGYRKIGTIAGCGGFYWLAENSYIALGSSTKSKITWDGGETWKDCYPGSTIWEIGGVLKGDLIALAKSDIYKIPLIDLEAPSSEAEILSFVLSEQTGSATIDAANHTIHIEVATGTDVTALSPTLTISEEAMVSPASGVAQDFTDAVVYTVTAEDGETKVEWTVTVTVLVNVSNHPADQISFYPNPAREKIYLRNFETVNRIEVFSITGESVLSMAADEIQEVIGINILKQGVYFIKFEDANGSVLTKKFLKQ